MGHPVMDWRAWQEVEIEERSFDALRMTAKGGAVEGIDGGGAGS